MPACLIPHRSCPLHPRHIISQEQHGVCIINTLFFSCFSFVYIFFFLLGLFSFLVYLVFSQVSLPFRVCTSCTICLINAIGMGMSSMREGTPG
ncbi:hypothetical protein ASPTUDRAFT_715456 [Aspergillus tubingensis CBS 134.48]|uniref:Uncharacterized protein n=1 Tax=Aspergillus tubingensis (strain CBS 134.48) TaxID=767770 RepID=A0A1L9N221_ASPTC|nr:hypothetical protein ASPTUDRAFT_715456 [Aspergillus tubingensis CBS 134.48]